jgi:phospholipid/cholesterol/gamma-HCH transport system ATP-binding protein
MTERAVAIRCRGLEKGFPHTPVLRGVALDVRRGETLVLLGGSGSGKSVLLKHLNGLLRPDAGTVEVDGVEVSALAEDALVAVRRRMGMLFQQGALFDSLTVGDNVAFPLREHRVAPERELPARIAEALAMVGLEGTERLMPAELSGGMRKRAALARALVLRPTVLLYDEPTTGLDPVVAAKINHLIRDLQRRLGVTSVVVTHDLGSAFLVADRIAFLYEGRIRFAGTPDEARAASDPPLREFLTAA